MTENHIKLLFTHDAFEEESIESAWALKVENGYQLDNILFYAKNYSFADIIFADEIDGELFVKGLIEEKGHSTIRLLFNDVKIVPEIREELKNLNCSSELSNIENMIAVDIPPEVKYLDIKVYLDKGENESKWEYQEACIASNHQVS